MLFSVSAICLSILQLNKWILKTFIGSILCLFSIVWTIIHGVIIVPISTTLRCFTQLITLPINIPLYIISGTSIQSIITTTAKSINVELIGIISQYCMALLLSGTILGAFLGLFLGMVHINTYLRDYILEFDIRTTIKRLLQRVYNYIVNMITAIVLYIKHKAQTMNKFNFKSSTDNITTDISTDDLNIPLRWLKNFNFTEDNDSYDATTIKEEHTILSHSKLKPDIPYNTPPGSPKLNSLDETEFQDESLNSPVLKTSTLKQRRTKKVDTL